MFFLGSSVEKSVGIMIRLNGIAKIINLIQVTTNHSVFNLIFIQKTTKENVVVTLIYN